MSCFMVSEETIELLVQALTFTQRRDLRYYWDGEWRSISPRSYEDQERMFSILAEENARAVRDRYGDEIDLDQYRRPQIRKDLPRSMTVARRVLGAIACYRYQACDSNTWEDSEAKKIVDALEREVIRWLSVGWEVQPDEVLNTRFGNTWNYYRWRRRVEEGA